MVDQAPMPRLVGSSRTAPVGSMPLGRAVLSGLAVLLGLAVLVTAGTEFAHDRSLPGAFGTTASPNTAGRSAPLIPTQPGPTQPGPTPPRPAPAVPATLAIPVLGVRATVVPVQATSGVLDVPPDPAQVGWWSASAFPGAATGSVVIDGHVDSAATGPGALFHLADLRDGDLITATTAAGDGFSYLVTGRRVYTKSSALPADLFTVEGPARLVLITCGGPFDRAAGSYLDNVVVFAAAVNAANSK
jgi:hypothetical protein